MNEQPAAFHPLAVEQFTNAAGTVYCTIYIDAASQIVSDVWSGPFGRQENFRKVLLSVLETARKFRATKWLADLSEMEGGFKGSEKWLQEYVMPEAEKSGIRYEAVVLSQDIYARLAATDSVRKINELTAQGDIMMGSLKLRQFTDYPTALAWLQSR